MPTYARADLAFARGEGAWIWTTDGRKFLDLVSGIAVNALGHCHPALVAAVKAQAEKLWHCSNLYRIPEQEKLCQRLVETSFADAAFICNSGAEALEGAIKACRKYHYETGNPQKTTIITVEGAFHGRTLATIAAGRQAKHLKGFDPVTPGFVQVPFGNLNALRNAITSEVGGILFEPVQGEGGIRAGSEDYLRGLRAACDEFGLLLIFDEVQCGNGRTGKLWAYEWAGVAPDIMATAKGLGGGFPIGAWLATERVAKHMSAGTHGSTFGGNPLACAVANAVYDVILAPGFLERVQESGKAMKAALQGVVARNGDIFAEVRGSGLMLGLACNPPNGDLYAIGHECELLTVPAGDNVLRILPPLTVGKAEIEAAVERLEKVAATARARIQAAAKGAAQ
ncbi:MAG: aspartate aminotransferase family protein [Alphaproteobacteria bacterium]|nr:aspartate aminotransferase family protein [Alphaproteobacteria bacterium]